MLKRLDKIRFRGSKRDEFLDLAESPTASDNEGIEDIMMKPRLSLRDSEELREPLSLLCAWSQSRSKDCSMHRMLLGAGRSYPPFNTALCIFRANKKQKGVDFSKVGSGSLNMAGVQDLRSDSERLNEVKGHLEIALLEKHFLQEELRKLREETNVETLKQELERERCRRLELEQKMNDVLKARLEDSPPQISRKQPSPSANGTGNQTPLVRNLFGKMADVLEKIKNLFMWVQPEITQKLYIGLWVAFISSCILPYKLMGFLIGLYAGIKFFIIDFLFKSCPKLRDKYDTPYIVWNNLPTDPQLKERSNATISRRIPPVVSRSSLATIPSGMSREDDSGRSHNTKRGAFHEIFNLAETERPLPVCENGWRCCLINRDRKMPTDYIRNGLLYVTENYLCFESSSSRSGSSKKNKVIKLEDITDIQKYKVLSVLPGSGMGISIATPSTQKPLVFGAMIHRDEAFEAIFTQYMKIVTTGCHET
ncbi:GRAM domain-containing protein 4 isoform X2 [Tachysurus ichikawai]